MQSGVKALLADTPSIPAPRPSALAFALAPQGLAKSIAWDGEGATCLLEIEVKGAKTDDDARIIARSVAGSSLAKSAFFGHDPNWGRIAAAAGYSGEHVPCAAHVAASCRRAAPPPGPSIRTAYHPPTHPPTLPASLAALPPTPALPPHPTHTLPLPRHHL